LFCLVQQPGGGDAVIHPLLVELLRPVLPALVGPQGCATLSRGEGEGLVVRLLRSDGEGDPGRGIVRLGVGQTVEAGDRVTVADDDRRLEPEQLGGRACAGLGGAFPGSGRITSEQLVPSGVDTALCPPVDCRTAGTGVRRREVEAGRRGRRRCGRAAAHGGDDADRDR